MKLFAYGCSYTFGSELADEDVTGMSRKETDALKSKIGESAFYEKYVERANKWHMYNRLMKERSYANYIAKTLGLDTYINRAVPGASNTHIFYQLLEDINSNNIDKDDIIFVGVTSFTRFSWHNESRNRLESCMIQGGLWPSKKFKDQYVKHVSDKDYILQNIQSIYAMKSLAKNYKFFYQTVHWPLTRMYPFSDVGNPLYKSIMNINNDIVLPGHCLFFETPDPDNYQLYTHAFNHPYKEFHESFGNKLGEKIREKI